MSTIHTPCKLMKDSATPMPIEFEQFASPMIHPVTGKTISSYKKLMHDPATAKVWQTAFDKDFSGMAQGCNKTGHKGSDAMFVMTHNKNTSCHSGKKVFYLRKSCCQFSAIKGQSTSYPHHSRGQLDHTQWRRLHLHG
jgi:hypothetical protein